MSVGGINIWNCFSSSEKKELKHWQKRQISDEFSKAGSEAVSNEQPAESGEALKNESSTNVNSKNEVLDELTASFEEMNNKIIESNNKVLEAIKESLPENYTLPNDTTLKFFQTQNETKTE